MDQIRCEDVVVHFTVRDGKAQMQSSDDSLKKMMNYTGDALYSAKFKGRNKVMVFT